MRYIDLSIQQSGSKAPPFQKHSCSPSVDSLLLVLKKKRQKHRTCNYTS